MFGGKRERALLEEELLAVRKEKEQKEEALSNVLKKNDKMTEQFARMSGFHTQLEQDVMQIKEQVEAVHAMAGNGEKTAGGIHNVLVEIKNGIGTFDANHSVFVRQMRTQAECITEMVEHNKHFTTPMKYITEAQTAYKDECEQLSERTQRMMELSKNMSVLALNAAIEAGRMGESGLSFVAAAEEVRNFSENYELEARGMQEQLADAQTRIAELEEQVHHLNELLKENNISMAHLYKDSAQNLAVYEGSQIDIRELMPEEMIGRADALRQLEQEHVKTHTQLLEQLEHMSDEIEAYQGSADELEGIWKAVCQSIS